MAYDIDALGSGCYPGTSVLVNRLGIQDQAQLDENETLITTIQSAKFELDPFPEKLDFQYYKRIHLFLFEQLYDWVGEVCSVNISKQRTRFCPADEINSTATALFKRLDKISYLRGLPRKEFLLELVDLYTSLNDLHPFREGNGRVQRLYFRQLAKRAGYDLNFSKVDSDQMMIATIHASSGVSDTLYQVFDQIVEKSQ